MELRRQPPNLSKYYARNGELVLACEMATSFHLRSVPETINPSSRVLHFLGRDFALDRTLKMLAQNLKACHLVRSPRAPAELTGRTVFATSRVRAPAEAEAMNRD